MRVTGRILTVLAIGATLLVAPSASPVMPSNWVIVERLTEPGGVQNDSFGVTVSLDGSRLLVGSVGEDSRGSAHVFELLDGVWAHTAEITAPGNPLNFGQVVALDGNHALVSRSTGVGEVHAYELVDGTWEYVGALVDPESAGRDLFGRSIDIDGRRAVVGAWGDDEDSGAAHVFDLVDGAWAHTQKLTDPNRSKGDDFGYSVAIDRRRVVVGAPSDGPGAAHVFDLRRGTWRHMAELNDPNGESGDVLGWSVDVDGGRVVAGAWGDDAGRRHDAGALHLFESGDAGWEWRQALHVNRPDHLDQLGSSVSIDGDRILAGVRNAGLPDEGAHLFELVDGVWTHTFEVLPPRDLSATSFGESVSLDGVRGAIGAPRTLGATGMAFIASPTCDGLPATHVGAPGDDVIKGTGGDDVIVTFDGADTVDGRRGDDVICTGDDDDLVRGGAGDDIVYAGRGDDTVYGNNGRDELYGEAGDDFIGGGKGKDLIVGDQGHDELLGGDRNDTILGGPGDDRIVGNAEDDRLDGGTGTDQLIGGPGVDTCTAGEIHNGCESIN